MEGVGHDAVVGVSLDAGVGVGVDARVREHGLVSDQALSSAFLGSWGRVDVVEESLEIVAGKRTVHLLVRP